MRLLAILLLAALPLAAEQVTITGTATYADGTPGSGELVITYQQFLNENGDVIGGMITSTIGPAGAISVQLWSNASSYTIRYEFDLSDQRQTRFWNVPFGQGTSLGITDVEVPTPTNVTKAPVEQISTEGADPGDVVTAPSGSAGDAAWAPPTGGGGGNVSSVFGRTGDVVATEPDYAAFNAPWINPQTALVTPLGTDSLLLQRADDSWFRVEWSNLPSGGTMDHSALSNLDYASAGHTGFEAAIAGATSSLFWDGSKTFRQIVIGDVSGLQAALDGKEPVITGATSSLFWDGAKVFRAIAIGDVTGLQAALDAKVATTRLLTGGSGVAPIGDLSQDRTIDLDFLTETDGGTPNGTDKLLIQQAGGLFRRIDVSNLPTGGGGEANTSSNAGAAGVGVTLPKSGIDLPFKSINAAGSNRIVVSNDAANSEVDLDVNEGNLQLPNLGGLLTDAQLASAYSGVGSCTAGQFAVTLARNAAPSCLAADYGDLSGVPSTFPPDAHAASHEGGSDTLDLPAIPGQLPTSRSDFPFVNGTPQKLEDVQTVYYSSGIAAGGAITDGGGQTINVAAGNGLIRTTAAVDGELKTFSWSAANGLAIPNNETRYVTVDYNAGSPVVALRTSYDQNNWTEILLGNVTNDQGELIIASVGWLISDGLNRQMAWTDGVNFIDRDLRDGGLNVTPNGVNVQMDAGSLWGLAQKFAIAAIDTSGADTFTRYYGDGAGGFTKVSAQTEWNDQFYDDGSGTLQPLGNNQCGTNWYTLDTSGNLAEIIGTVNISGNQCSQARDAPPPPFPPFIWNNGIPLSRWVIQEGEASPMAVENVFDPLTSFTVQAHPELTQRDAAGQHPATSITNSPAGGVSATTTQEAIDELDAEKVAGAGLQLLGSSTSTCMAYYSAGSIVGPPETTTGAVCALRYDPAANVLSGWDAAGTKMWEISGETGAFSTFSAAPFSSIRNVQPTPDTSDPGASQVRIEHQITGEQMITRPGGGVVATSLYADAPLTAGNCMQAIGPYTAATTGAACGSGGGGGPTELILDPQEVLFPLLGDVPAGSDLLAAGGTPAPRSFVIPLTATQSIQWNKKIPENYTGATTLEMTLISGASSGTVVLESRIACIKPGDGKNLTTWSYDTVEPWTGVSLSGTPSGQELLASHVLVNLDGMSASARCSISVGQVSGPDVQITGGRLDW